MDGGFFDGVPLGTVRNGRFVNKLGAFFTMTKLVYNGILYDFAAQSGGSGGGSVSVDSEYYTWRFVAPNDGRFDLAYLETLTLSGMLNSVADTVEQTPVSEWESFAEWLNTPEIAKSIQKIFDTAAFVAIEDVILQPPVFVPPANFSAFLRWLCSISGEAGNLPSKQFRIETGFKYPVKTYVTRGLDIYVKSPSTRPDVADGTEIIPAIMAYTTLDGSFDRPVLVIEYPAAEGYDALIFVYDTTVLQYGETVTLETGWYTINGTTGDTAPYDIEANPISAPLSAIEAPQNVMWDVLYPFITPVITGEPDGILAFTFQL